MKDVISRVQRELPDTDQTRYDVAYERGKAQARSKLMFGGLAVGSAVGAGLMWLFDPERGRSRRAQLASRVEGLRNDMSRTAEGRGKDIGNRLEGFAIERGIKEPPRESRDEGDRDFGDRYRTGFGQTEADPLAPGSHARDAIRTEEVAVYGASGPVAGAASADEIARERAEGR
jgi:hypothetical protein